MERLPVMYIYCSFFLKSIFYSCTCSYGRIIKINYSCAPNVLGPWLAMRGVNPGRVWLAMQFWGDGCCSKAGEAWYHYKSESTFFPLLLPLDQSMGTFLTNTSAQNHDFAETFTGSKVFASTDHHVVTCLLSASFCPTILKVCFTSRILLEEFAVFL
jgi:hypothetical protein